MLLNLKSCFLFSLLLPFVGLAQQAENSFSKPKPFSFLTNIPHDVAGYTKQSFKKNNLSALTRILGSTAILILADQTITNTVQDVAEDHNINQSERFSPIFSLNIGGKKTNFGKIPKNINTAFYDLGQGSSAMLLAAGFFLMGKIKHDNRALQTASQLTEAFIVMGVGTQVMKYASGRENPSDATVRGGRWQPFPSWSNFQNHKPRYDAFPSGHLASFISAITIVSNNYPEKRWIRPVGYCIAGLCSIAMINNGVHWASDFPLGFALGHGFGKFISKKHRVHSVSGSAAL